MSEFTEKIEEEEEQEEFATEDVVRLKLECECNNNEDSITKICQKIESLNKNIENSRVVYYPDYILEEKEANVLIATLQPNKYNFKDFMFKVREKNIRVILILENEQIPELKDALFLGIYDFIFDPFEIEDIKRKVAISTPFSEISKYIEKYLN